MEQVSSAVGDVQANITITRHASLLPTLSVCQNQSQKYPNLIPCCLHTPAHPPPLVFCPQNGTDSEYVNCSADFHSTPKHLNKRKEPSMTTPSKKPKRWELYQMEWEIPDLRTDEPPEEDQVIRDMYQTATPQALLDALPRRPWEGIRCRAGELKIVRPLSMREKIPYRNVSREDVQLAQELGIPLEEITTAAKTYITRWGWIRHSPLPWSDEDSSPSTLTSGWL
jgi:hypothetical protein